MPENSATLYVVATPIGNLEDFSPRARRILGEVDIVAAEDTRHTRRLLTHFGIETRLIAFHEHNEAEMTARLVERLRDGQSIALVSDAGTPLLNDPGYRLVSAAAAAGLDISPVPGPSAALAALSVAGLPAHRFLFVGFLPARTEARREALVTLRDEPNTLVIFESVHRCGETLRQLVEVFGEKRPAVLARELTKRHETVHRGSTLSLAESWDVGEIVPKGEIVLCVGGCDTPASKTADGESLLRSLLEELPLKTAVRLAAEHSGSQRNALYELALSLRSGNEEDEA